MTIASCAPTRAHFPLIEHLQRRGARPPQARSASIARHAPPAERTLRRAGRGTAPPFRSPRPPPPIPCCPARPPRAPRPAPRCRSSARRTPSARLSRPPPAECRARPRRRCIRSAPSRRESRIRDRRRRRSVRSRQTARAACGISNAPATEMTSTSPGAAPAAVNAATAPSRRRSVIALLKRDTTTANRRPEASGSGPGVDGWRMGSEAWMGGRDALSVSREHRAALLEKRAGAFPHVVRAEHETEERRLERLRVGEGMSAPRFTASRMYRTAMAGFVASVSARARAVSIRSAAGTTRLTSPNRYASRASMRSPVSRSSSARPRPDQPGQTLRAPVPGNQPEIDLRLPERRRVRGQTDGARHGQLAARRRAR